MDALVRSRTTRAEEIEFHRNMKQRELEKAGLPAVETSSASRRALGNVVLAREDSRAVWIWPWLESMLKDVRYALRTMRKMPGFTSIAVLALTIGIGSATTIFSVIYNVLLEPFPYKGSDRLVNVAVHDSQQSEPGGRPVFSVPEFLDYQDQNHVFEGVIGTRIQDVLYSNGEGTEQFRGAAVTPNTFSFLGHTGATWPHDHSGRREAGSAARCSPELQIMDRPLPSGSWNARPEHNFEQ